MFLIVDKDGKILCKLKNIKYVEDKWVKSNTSSLIQIDNVDIVEVENDKNSEYYYNGKFRNQSKVNMEDKRLNIIKQLEQEGDKMQELIEDLTAFCETLGFIPTQSKKDILAKRKNLKTELKDLE